MPHSTGLQGAMVPSTSGEGEGLAASGRSGGSGTTSHARIPLSARSNASVVPMHANCYSYLNDRVYNFAQARSMWLGRVRSEIEGRGSEAAALKRLPADFDPFFAVDGRGNQDTKPGEGSKADRASKAVDQANTEAIGRLFRVVYAIFSSRAWDRLYLVLALLWSVLCPGYLDSVFSVVERRHLAWMLLAMSALALVPSASSVLFKAFLSSKLRPCLRESKHYAGVCFVLATKSVPVLAFRAPKCCGRRLLGRKVYPGTKETGERDVEAPNGGTDAGRPEQRASLGQISSISPHIQGGQGQFNGAEKSLVVADRGVVGGKEVGQREGWGARDGCEGSTAPPELALPPRYWRCTVCKKVNMLPDNWDGRAGEAVHVVIKRKTVDKQAMYGDFKTTPNVPRCNKCRTPFDYRWRNGSGADPTVSNNNPKAHGNHLLPTTPMTATITSAVTAKIEAARADTATVSRVDTGACQPPSIPVGQRLKRWIRRTRKRGLEIGASRDSADQPGLWYGREFHYQLKTYFKPELQRPSLSSSLQGGGGQYPVGARIACFAGKQSWYPGTIKTARGNNTYDVRYDNGDIAQHVFPHMIRFEPIHTRDSRLVCLFYGMVLAAAVIWPFVGFRYFSREGGSPLSDRGPMVAAPALLLGLAGVTAVTLQWWTIYSGDRSAGLLETARYVAVFGLPSASLAMVGGTALVKAANPAISGSWIEMLLLPGLLFSITAGGYAHAVSPAYGKAWCAASFPWILFLLLVSLRLDGEAGDARPAFGRMRWMGVFFPLWILLLMILAAHHVLPLVWNVEGYPERASVPSWLARLGRYIEGTSSAIFSAIARAREKNRGKGSKALLLENDDQDGVKGRPGITSPGNQEDDSAASSQRGT